MHRPQDDVVPLHEPFETALRGFNRQQVLGHIESLDGRITMVMKDRESALTQVAELSRTIDQMRKESGLLAHLHRETEQVKEQAERMAQAPLSGASIRIQRIVRLAEEEAAELKARAEKEISEYKTRILQEIHELRAGAEKEVGELRVRAEREIARRESDAADRIRVRDQRGLVGLHLLLAIVGPRLAERVSAIERMEAQLAMSRTRTSQEVATLEMFRAKVTAQLSATRLVVAEALEQVQQTKIDNLSPTPDRPVPIQCDRHPAGRRGVESGTQQLVNNIRADERR